jgi:FlaA1/EpsC-like NDP-sugar epimerase
MVTQETQEKLTAALVHRFQRLQSGLPLLPLFCAIHLLAYWLRFEGQLVEVGWRHLLVASLVVSGIKFFLFSWLRVDVRWSRFVTFHDLVTLAQAVTLSSFLILLTGYLAIPALQAPRSVFLMDWAITLLVVGAIRSLARLIQERELPLLKFQRTSPVIIVGANESGETLLRAIRRNNNLSHRVVGFCANDASLLGAQVAGVPVLGMASETCQIAKAHQVSEVLIMSGELSGQTVRRLVEDCRQHGVVVKVLPSYEQLLRGTMNLRPREVSIEDLLRRDPVQLNLSALHGWIDDHPLLVTGSAGSIGSEICRQLVQFAPSKLVLVDQSETGLFFLEREMRSLAPDLDVQVYVADVCDRPRMEQIFSEQKPGIVFHAAAYKHVSLMESNPSEAVRNITQASRLLADISHQHEVKSFVMISTDKAVNPTSMMGACKRAAELYVQALAAESSCRYVTVRFGNVLDSAGSVVPIFRQQIECGGPLTVTHPDMKRYFMTIPEASQLVIQAGAMGQGGEIFVLDMGEPVSIVKLAEDIIRLSGLKVGEDIDIEFVGKRPGEKLFEELHITNERHVATSHPKIMVAASEPRDLGQVRFEIERLQAIGCESQFALRAALQELVPEFDISADGSRPMAA